MLREPNEVRAKGDRGTLVVSGKYAEEMGWMARDYSFTTDEIRNAVRRALERQRSACLDVDADFERVMEEIMSSIDVGARCDPLCGQDEGHTGPHDNNIEPLPRNPGAQPIMEILLYPNRRGIYCARVTEEDGLHTTFKTHEHNELDALEELSRLLGG